MASRSTLRSRVRQLVNDTNSIRFTDANLNTALDFANIDAITRLGPFDVSNQTGTLTGSDTFASSEPNYGLDEDLTIYIKELRVENQNDEERRIEIITQDELITRYGDKWMDNVATNLGEPRVAYVVDHHVFGLYPRPNLAQNGNTWRAQFYRTPSAFASDSDSPVFLRALHDALCWHVVSFCHWQLGDREASEHALNRYKTLIREFYSTATRFADELKGPRWDVG